MAKRSAWIQTARYTGVSHANAKERAVTAVSRDGPIKAHVCALYECGVRRVATGVEGIQRSQHARRCYLEDCAREIDAGYAQGRAVKIPIGALHEPGDRAGAVVIAITSVETVQRSKSTIRGNFENRAPPVGSAEFRCSIEAAVAT